MSDDSIELSRRKLLAGVSAVGVAGAGAGLGTSALFSDEERFGNNRVVAGELDMRVAWESYYSNQASSSVPFQRVDGSLNNQSRVALPANATDVTSISIANESQAQTFLEDIQADTFPDGYDSASSSTTPCPNGLGDADRSPPAVKLTDVKPGDFGSVVLDFALCDNPGFVWLRGQLTAAEENGRNEPESSSADERAAVVELLDAAQAAIWVDDGDGIQNSRSLVASGSLRQILNALGAGEGLGLSGDVSASESGGQGRNCFSTNTTHSVVVAWRVPIGVGNQIQSDRVAFDVGLYTEQCRNNSASGAGGGYLPQSKLSPRGGSAGDQYGRSVSVSGSTAMVGAPNGSVYVLERDAEGTWVQQDILGTDADDEFGTAIDLNGDTAVISAPGASEARVYTRQSGSWNSKATLEPSDNPTSIGYEAVALGEDTAVVSGYDDAYVFDRGGGWSGTSTESTQLSTDNGLPAAGLAVDGDTLLIGAPAVTNFRPGGPGKMYIYDLSNRTDDPEIVQSGTLQDFGAAVALSDDAALVGAPLAGESGAVHVYERGSWHKLASLTASNAASGAEFGRTVTVAGTTALVGAPADDGSTAESGAAYVFDGENGWPGIETQRLVPSDRDGGNEGDKFGSGLALSSAATTAFVGAQEGDGTATEDSGAVYVFNS